MDSSDGPSVCELVKDYAQHLGRKGWLVLGSSLLGGGVAVVIFFWSLANAPVPPGYGHWVWLILGACILILLVMPFFAFRSSALEYTRRIRESVERHKELDRVWQQRFSDYEQEQKNSVSNVEKYASDQTSRAVIAEDQVAQLREKLAAHEEQLRPKLEFGEIHSDRHVHIKVKNASMADVEARVQITKINHDIGRVLPVDLEFADDRSAVRSLGPGETANVHVCYPLKHNQVKIAAASGKPFELARDLHYAITLEARARGAQPTVATFNLSVLQDGTVALHRES